MSGRDAQHAQADALVKAGRFDEAERLLRDVVARDPGDAGALIRLSNLFGRRGDLDSAEGAARQAARIEPDSEPIAQHLRSVKAAKQYRAAMMLAQQQKTDE